MNGVVPWRGGRENDPIFMKILIEALIKPKAVVLNVYASTYDIYYHFHSRNTMTQGMVFFGPSANFVRIQMPRASIHKPLQT